MAARYLATLTFGFGCFILYRVWSALLFDYPLSLLACIICGIVSAGLFYQFEKWATLHFGIVEMQRRTSLLLKDVRNPLLTHVPLFTIANMILGILVSVGFSEDFIDISLDYGEDWLLFAIGFAIPAIALYFYSKSNARVIARKSVKEASSKKDGV